MARIRFSLLFLLLLPALVLAHGGSLVVTPAAVLQGEPFLVTVKGIDIRDIKKFTLNGKAVPLFLSNGKPTALIGVDLNARAGRQTLKAVALDGDETTATVTITKRPAITAPLGIPEKLGGNTKKAQKNLVSQLNRENAVLAKAAVSRVPFWKEPFVYPVVEPVVTDNYGYSRKTGSYYIPHKGTDFRAAAGTPVYAVGPGIVKLARAFTVYGNTVVIDHGGGVSSMSMHLSKLYVAEGQRVERSSVIGYSGDTGYALEPHLHLSIRIGGISIDPMKFFALLGTTTPPAR